MRVKSTPVRFAGAAVLAILPAPQHLVQQQVIQENNNNHDNNSQQQDEEEIVDQFEEAEGEEEEVGEKTVSSDESDRDPNPVPEDDDPVDIWELASSVSAGTE